jgi:primosomal protein N' (replication factor Y)
MEAERMSYIAKSLLPPGAEMLGPAECPIAVISGKHRRQIILRAPSMTPLHAAFTAMLAQYRRERRNRHVYLEIDVDPVSVL